MCTFCTFLLPASWDIHLVQEPRNNRGEKHEEPLEVKMCRRDVYQQEDKSEKHKYLMANKHRPSRADALTKTHSFVSCCTCLCMCKLSMRWRECKMRQPYMCMCVCVCARKKHVLMKCVYALIKVCPQLHKQGTGEQGQQFCGFFVLHNSSYVTVFDLKEKRAYTFF